MKRYWITGLALTFTGILNGQQQEGKIVYERVTQMQIRVAGMGDGVERHLPQSRTDKMEVLFGKNQSLKRPVVDETPEPTNFEGGGLVIRTFGGGVDDITYFNYGEKRMVDQREFGGKKYLINDSIRSLEWKITGESKTILGLACQQATTQRIATRFANSIVNGEMKRGEVTDTLNIVVWFTPAIPVPAGPDYQGQLPGAILEININNGQTVYKAIEISPKAELASIKEPKSGKKVTLKEFVVEQEKVMKDMQNNRQFRRVN